MKTKIVLIYKSTLSHQGENSLVWVENGVDEIQRLEIHENSLQKGREQWHDDNHGINKNKIK